MQSTFAIIKPDAVSRNLTGEILAAMEASGPVVCVVLRGEDAVPRWRALMGATNPAQAEPGTLRHKYGQSLEANAVHAGRRRAGAGR